MNILNEKRRVEIWLTHKESDEKNVYERLKPLYAMYKNKKYKVVVFESGRESLLENTKELIKCNIEAQAKQKSAQKSENQTRKDEINA